MIKSYKPTLFAILCSTSLFTSSLPAADQMDFFAEQSAASSQNLLEYLKNLGGYLGFDLKKAPPSVNNLQNQSLFNVSASQLIQNYLFNTYLGALPVTAIDETLSQFVPNSVPQGGLLNGLANYTFKSGPFNAPSQQDGTVSVSELVDQKTYQQDPVSQAVLNILNTPDSSYCMNYDGSAWNQNCSFLYQNKVLNNVIGTLPNTYSFFSFDYNKQLLGQLNGNSLLGPLMYSTENKSSNSTSSGTPNTENQGLKAQSQAQQAANFVRYASGSLLPIDLPRLMDYDIVYSRATNANGSIPKIQQMQSQAALSRYLTSLRVYAAQSSVGISNIYFILSKRMPQNQSAQESKPSSQALAEFTMATRRLFSPDKASNEQWISQINNAYPDTVQKEIAVLLAEINYQLYLSRQQEERILLTNSLLLLQNIRTTQPTADFNNTLSVPDSVK